MVKAHSFGLSLQSVDMQGSTIAFIGRSQAFSPQSIEQDAAILAAVRSHLLSAGFECLPVSCEDEMISLEKANVYLTMGRRLRTLELLSQQQQDLLMTSYNLINGRHTSDS